jgi:hypothetical protein
VGGALHRALLRVGLVGAAFVGALVGVSLTLLMAAWRRAAHGAAAVGRGGGRAADGLADGVVMLSPEALRGKQVFLLGSTSFLGWSSVAVLVGVAGRGAAAGMRMARALDALVLGDATATSLGLPLGRVRLLLVALMAWPPGPRWRRWGWWPLSAWWRRTWCGAAWSSRTAAAGAVGAGRWRAAAGRRRGRAQPAGAAGAAGGHADRGLRRPVPAAPAAPALTAVRAPLQALGLTLRWAAARVVDGVVDDLHPGSGRPSWAPTARARARCCRCWPGCACPTAARCNCRAGPGRLAPRERAQRLAWLAQAGEADGDIASATWCAWAGCRARACSVRMTRPTKPPSTRPGRNREHRVRRSGA